MTSQLILEFPDTQNLKTFRVMDASFYNENLPVDCGLLEITPPGMSDSANFNVNEKFDLIINSSNLGLTRLVSTKNLPTLQDGIYKIKYSIKPNNKLWVEYNYFRNQSQHQLFVKEVTALYNCRESMTKKEFDIRLKELVDAKHLMDLSKTNVEDLNNPTKGINYYNDAQKLLINKHRGVTYHPSKSGNKNCGHDCMDPLKEFLATTQTNYISQNIYNSTTSNYYTIDNNVYTYTQNTPASVWNVTHNLGYFPNVTMIDPQGYRIEGIVNYDTSNVNILTILFTTPQSGKAFLS
jgi:hypothetical protein